MRGFDNESKIIREKGWDSIFDTTLLMKIKKRKIEELCEEQLDKNKKIDINKIALKVGDPCAMVRQYLVDFYGDRIIQRFRYKSSYYNYRSKVKEDQYIRFNDYDQMYYHQYVMMIMLELNIEDIKKYIVHHKNGMKLDNNFNNLHLFLNSQMHTSFHIHYSKNPDIDIVNWSYEYIEKDLKDIEDALTHGIYDEEMLLECKNDLLIYTSLLDKLVKLQKRKNALDIPNI